jgi:hypothetical protein
MPFDPTFPPPGADILSEPFRNQFHALKDLIDTQAATIAAQGNQIATLQAALDSVPPGQPVLTLQYVGGSEVPMVVNAPRANTVWVQRRYQGETEWSTVATLQYWGPDSYTDTLPGTGVFEYRLIGVNGGGPGTPSEVGTVSAV